MVVLWCDSSCFRVCLGLFFLVVGGIVLVIEIWFRGLKVWTGLGRASLTEIKI